MPKRKFESQQEVYDLYDKAEKVLGKQNKIYNNSQKILFELFTSGVEYTDPQTHEKKICNIKMDSADKQQLAKEVYGEGEQLIRECGRYPGGNTAGMTWYCLSKGITIEQLYELGEHPDSPQSQRLKTQIAGMKQDYHDMITSNDPEKLSDFFVSCFQKFEHNSKNYLKANTLDGLQTEWEKLMFWQGAGSIIQQSWENCNRLSDTSQKQHALIDKVQEKVNLIWGPDSSIRGILGVMNLINTAANRFAGANINGTPIDGSDEATAEKKRRAIADNIIGFKIVHDHLDREFTEGRIPNFFAEKTGKAAIINERAYSNAFQGGEIARNLQDMELRCLAGGDGICLYDPEHVCDFQNAIPNSRISLDRPVEAFFKFFDERKLEEFLETGDFDKEGAFEELTSEIQKKAEKHENLTPLEMGLFLSEKTCFGEKEQELYDQFMGKSDMLRFSGLPKTMQGILGTISRTQFGVEPEVFVSRANVVKNKCDASFLKTVSNIRTKNSADLINADDNAAMLTSLRDSLKEVDVTIASSAEFKKLANAFRKVDKSAEEIKGNEAAYQEDMKALATAAKEYIQAKNNGSNTKERFTDRGQKRLNLARRMEAFGNATAAGLDKTMDALQKLGPDAVILPEDQPETEISHTQEFNRQSNAEPEKQGPDLSFRI